MKKLIIAVSSTLLLALLLSPLVIGINLKPKLEQFYEKLSENTLQYQPNINLSLKNYQRGWFQSNVDVELTLPEMEESFIVGQLTIKHGPIVRHAKKWKLGFASISEKSNGQSFLKPLLADEDITFSKDSFKTQTDTIVNFNGIANGTIQIAEINLQSEEDGVSFVMHESHGSFKLDSELTDLAYTINIPGILLEGPDAVINIEQMSFSSVMNNIDTAILPDNIKLSVQSISIYEDEVDVGRLSNLAVDLTTEDEDNAMSIELAVKLDDYQSLDYQLGESEIVFAIEQLNSKVLTSLIEQIAEIEASNMNAQDKQFAYIPVVMQFPQLLEKDLSLQLKKLHITQDEEQVIGAAKIVLNETVSLNDMQDIDHVLAKVDGSFNMTAPVELTKKILRLYLFRTVLEKYTDNEQADENAPLELDAVELAALVDTEVDNQIAAWKSEGFITGDEYNYTFQLLYKAGEIITKDRDVTLHDIPSAY